MSDFLGAVPYLLAYFAATAAYHHGYDLTGDLLAGGLFGWLLAEFRSLRDEVAHVRAQALRSALMDLAISPCLGRPALGLGGGVRS